MNSILDLKIWLVSWKYIRRIDMCVYFNIPDELIIDMYTSMFSTDISVECCKRVIEFMKNCLQSYRLNKSYAYHMNIV